MVQAGGPAAINGFLYQILKHLHWLGSARIDGHVSSAGVIGDARIILEPRDGGDARLQGQSVYLVEQYKTRPDGTWSVQSIIDDVLPDLRLAVPEPPPSGAEYRFRGGPRKPDRMLSWSRLQEGPVLMGKVTRKRYSAEFKAKVALEAIKGERRSRMAEGHRQRRRGTRP